MKALLPCLLALFTISTSADPLDYRFEAVRRNVLVQGKQAIAGQHARGGEKVSTGRCSSAKLVSGAGGATLELFRATAVTLGGDAPGVLLSVDRGRVRAVLDARGEPRVVRTPAALLAAREADLDVRVDASGTTTLRVRSGLVEVRSSQQQGPVTVRAGETLRLEAPEPPETAHPEASPRKPRPPRPPEA